MSSGDRKLLLQALNHMTVSELSANLVAMKSLPAPKSSTELVAQNISGEKVETYDFPKMVRDSKGNLHVVFVERHGIEAPDYLGNTSTWLSSLYHVERRAGEWLDPVKIETGNIYINGVRLLIDKDDILYLFWYGPNIGLKITDLAIPPGEYAILTSRRTLEGSWSQPESCTSEFPRFMNGFDVLLDAKANFHLAWSHWTTRFSPGPIVYRTGVPGTWIDEIALPTAGRRDMDGPVIRLIDGRLNLYATGQTLDNGTIGMFKIAKNGRTWNKPELIKNKTGFDLDANHPDERPLFWIPVYGKSKPTIMIVEINKRGKHQSHYFSFADVDFSLSNPARFFSDHGKIYGLLGWADALVLVRQNGSAWLGQTIARDISGRVDDVLFDDKSMYVLLTAGKFSDSIYLVQAPIPLGLWEAPEKLTAQLRAGYGLTPNDLQYLRTSVFMQGFEAQKQGRFLDALTKYFYVIRNFEKANETYAAWSQIQSIYKSGAEVRILLEYLASFYPDLQQKLEEANIAPPIAVP